MATQTQHVNALSPHDIRITRIYDCFRFPTRSVPHELYLNAL